MENQIWFDVWKESGRPVCHPAADTRIEKRGS